MGRTATVYIETFKKSDLGTSLNMKAARFIREPE
jgi:hypothetical protein